MRDKTLLPSLGVAGSGALWGLYWIPISIFNARGLDGAWVALVMFAISVLLLAGPFLARRDRGGGHLASQLTTGLLCGGAFMLYSVSLVLTDVVHSILLFYVTPVWSTLLGALLLGERITPSRIAAIVLGLAGLLLVLHAGAGIPWPRNLGDWLSLLAGVIWAYGSLRLFASEDGRLGETVFFFSLGGLLVSAVFVLLPIEGLSGGVPHAAILANLPWLVAMSVLVFVPSTYLIAWGAHVISPGRVGILLMTEVVVGTVTSALFSSAPFGWHEAAGALLILAAALVDVLGRSRLQPA
ncbi:MAG: DMT family transporter [Hyphomicrobiaceae bacterium]